MVILLNIFLLNNKYEENVSYIIKFTITYTLYII